MNRADKIKMLKALQAGRISIDELATTNQSMKWERLTIDELVLMEGVLTNALNRQDAGKRGLTPDEVEFIEYYHSETNKRPVHASEITPTMGNDRLPRVVKGSEEILQQWYNKLNIKPW